MAPKTPLAARTPAYLAQYGRTLGAAYRFERIQKEVGDEQARVQYLDSLIGQERQTLAGLQQVFRTEPLSFEAAQSLLGDLTAAERGKALAGAQGAAARKAATTLSKDERATLISAYAQNPELGFSAAEALITGATPEKAKAIIAALPARASAADKEALTQTAKRVATGKVPSGGAAAGTEQGKAVASALEAAFFAGPTGIRGGYEGMAVVERRKLTADQLEKAGDAKGAEALRKSGFATQQDALNAALENVRVTGDPAAIPDAYARDLYVEARNAQAYTNAERADFEQEVLDSRKRLANLEAERQRIAGAYDDPAQEAVKRELMARGYKFAERGSADEWMNRYVQYQNTPYYDVLLKADRLVDAAKRDAKPLGPSTKAQNMVTTLTMQYERTGTKFDLDTLRKQLEKAPDLTPAEVDDALGFIVAYRELGGDKQDPKQLEFLRKQEEFQKQSDEKRRQQAEAMKAEVDRARQVTRQLETEQVQAVSELRTEQAKANLPGQEYARLRAMGMSPEEARAKAMQLAVPVQTAELAGKVLMEPDLLMERQRRIEAAREAAKAAPAPEEITLRGGPIAVEAATAAPAPAPAPAPAQPIAQGDAVTEAFQEAGTPFSYRKTSKGDYLVFKDGLYSGKAMAGTRQAQSIERVIAGQAPLPPAAPKPKPAATPAPKAATPAPATKPLTDEELLKKYGG